MTTPFTFFRRNQQVMMVGVVILSMVAFTISDVFSDRQSQFVMLGIMLGGIIFAFTGIPRGKWIQYGLSGAVLGGLLGWLLPDVISPIAQYARTTKLGTFDRERLTQLASQRNLANAFMAQVVGFNPYGGAEFQFDPNNDENDLIFAEMLRAEADEIGLVVTNSMVNDYIRNRTGERLSAAQFAEVRTSLGNPPGSITEAELFDALREQIKARLAFIQLSPMAANIGMFTSSAASQSITAGPEVYYDVFRRSKVRQRMTTARLDVDAFVSQVPDPSDEEVAALFNASKTKFAGAEEPGAPGFRQPNKARLAWLELSYKTVEESTTPPTDAEIEAHYSEKKDSLYRKPAATPDVPPAPSPSTPDASAPASGAATDTTPVPELPSPDASTTAPETSAPPTEPAAPTAETPTSETPASDAATEGSSPANSSPDAPAPEVPAGGTSEPPSPGDECVPFVADEPATTEDVTNQPPTVPAATDAPAADTQTAAETDPPADPATPAANESATPAADNPPLTIPAADAAQQPAATPPATSETPGEPFTIPAIEYKPLDDDLKAQIRDRLLDEKVRAALKVRMDAALDEMRALEKSRAKYRGDLARANRDITTEALYEQMIGYSDTMKDGLKAIAEKHGLQYVESPLLSFELELTDVEAWPVGSANEWNDEYGFAAGNTVATTIAEEFPYRNPKDDIGLYKPRHAAKDSLDLDGGGVHYAWWVTEFAPSHVPELTDPGIREQVVLTIKRQKARELAKARGEELVKLVKEGLAKPEAERKDMLASLEGQTVLNTPDSPTLAVRPTDPFSWYFQSFVPNDTFMPQQRLEISEIRFRDETGGTLKLAGNRFMKAVFEDVPNDGVAVVANEDLSSYYVVHVVERTADDEILKQQFLIEGQRSRFNSGPIASVVRSTIVNPAGYAWSSSLWDKYDARPPELIE